MLNGLLPAATSSTGLLDDLTSGSKVAVWRLWAFVGAVSIWTHEQLFDLFKIEVNASVAAAKAGTLPWYHAQVLAFQFGDSLVYLGGQYRYAANDPDSRIIALASVEERPDGLVLVKVAKTGPAKLDETELAALNSYLQRVKFAGTKLAAISLEADVVTPVYDKLIGYNL